LARTQHSTEVSPTGTRFACRVEYNGESYNGWQSQLGDHVATIQDLVESALSKIAGCDVKIHCAGRTDSGVHGHAQIIHFDAPVPRSCKAWVAGGNTHLPRDIRIHWAVVVDETFHARHSATSRRYRYFIANTAIRSALLSGRVTWHRRPLDEQRMHDSAQCLLGEQDFSAFRASSCQSVSPMRNVHSLRVWRQSDLIVIELRANAFLHHMVRNIAGTLMAVGDGRRPVDWVEELLQGRDRTRAAETASAEGLYLVDVAYPSHFGLPESPEGPALLAMGI